MVDHPVLHDWEVTDKLPAKDAMTIEIQHPWKMYFDEAAHFGGVGGGVVFVTSQGEVLPFSFTLKQCCSNNVTKYQALILGLKMVVDMKQLQLQVFGDSQLVIKQLLGTYEVRKLELHPYHYYAQKLMGWLGDVCHAPNPMKADRHPLPIRPKRSNLYLCIFYMHYKKFHLQYAFEKVNSTNKPKGKAYD